MRGGNKGAPLWSNASSRRREREEARVGEREQSPSHARVSERRKALAVLPAVPPFAGRQKKRTSGRRVGPSRESPTLARGAAATTSARALSRRGAHACVSPSLGASRPVATHFESFRGDPGRSEVRERGNPLVKGATARSEWSGTRSLLESFGRKMREPRKGTACVTGSRKRFRCG
jgi:hypothetical protein